MLGLQILMEESVPNKIQEITVLLNFALFSRKPLVEIKSLKWWMSHPIEGIAAANGSPGDNEKSIPPQTTFYTNQGGKISRSSV